MRIVFHQKMTMKSLMLSLPNPLQKNAVCLQVLSIRSCDSEREHRDERQPGKTTDAIIGNDRRHEWKRQSMIRHGSRKKLSIRQERELNGHPWVDFKRQLQRGALRTPAPKYLKWRLSQQLTHICKSKTGMRTLLHDTDLHRKDTNFVLHIDAFRQNPKFGDAHD